MISSANSAASYESADPGQDEFGESLTRNCAILFSCQPNPNHTTAPRSDFHRPSYPSSDSPSGSVWSGG